MATEATFLRPNHRRTSAGDRVVDGVTFLSFDVGVLNYAKISEDGQIFVARNRHRTTYRAAVIGIGDIKTPSGMRPKAFHTEEAAIRGGIEALQGRKIRQ